MLNTDQRHHAKIVVKPRVDNQRLKRFIAIAYGRRNVLDQVLKGFLDTQPRFSADGHRLTGLNTDNLFDLILYTVWLCLRKVHFVQYGQHLKALLDRGIAVGHGLRLYALSCIDDQQRTLAGCQRARHFV